MRSKILKKCIDIVAQCVMKHDTSGLGYVETALLQDLWANENKALAIKKSKRKM